ncbi:RING finger protein 17 isoform X2 [Hippoglossus hippoglossus]|uniref:RING finger protein 17 isoform X2 n=1 Tax=Hippoglossus hippoglossus TaxID=8267 RepID=UPI00148C7EA7|nr:RING finger protein 17 isoform X2 [Hippoglossus hippoglossus]
MDTMEKPAAVTCNFCGEVFTLPEDDTDGNLPRVLLCGHIFCTSCLLSIQCDGVIKCPECEVESPLPEGGVCYLPEDSRIIGLIYTAKMNKMRSLQCDRSKNRRRNKLMSPTDLNGNTENTDQPDDIKKIERRVDEALVQAADNLAQLEHIHETLTTGQAEQVKREKARLEMEIKQVADKAIHAIHKWKDVQFNQVSKLEAQLSTIQAEVYLVQERIKALEIAMKVAREVRRVPNLGQYCTLDNVLETLKAPVDKQTFDIKSLTMGFGVSCVLQSECVNRSLALSLKLEVNNPKNLYESPPKGHQSGSINRKSPLYWTEGRKRNCTSPKRGKLPSPQRQEQESRGADSHSPQSSSPSPRPPRRSNLSHHGSNLDLGAPDVIIEELVDVGQQRALPPTGPELANDRGRISRRRRNQAFGNRRDVTQWVVVTHVVNPSHFYVRYMAERRDSEILSKRINQFCSREDCYFTSSDSVETGSLIFVKWMEGLWCRASVVEILQSGCVETVKTCKVTQLANVRVFFFENGVTENITIEREEGSSESSLNAVNNHLRKVVETVNLELGYFAPQAIRCSLKDLVPYDLTKGWSKEAEVEFRSVVGFAAVEMRPLGQDRDALLVDLRKVPMDQPSDTPICVREYLVFIEVARFYSPVTLSRKPLLFYPPVYPNNNRALNAVVSHINNPADFYIQLVDNMESLLLSVKLQNCYNATSVAGQDDLNIYCPSIGQACVARYDDKLWYRAQVMGHPGGRNVEVRFVDFGNIQILSVSDLRKMKDEFFALPSMAIHCCLSGVTPLDGETWSNTCTNRFISLAHEKLVSIVATGRRHKSGPLSVKMFECSLNGPQTNIAELLVNEELASFKDGYKSKHASSPGDDSTIWDPPLEHGSATEGIDSPDQKVPQDEEPLAFQPQLKLPAQLKDLKVKVTHVNSPSSFYVQLTQNDSQLKRVCELLKQECACTEPQDVVWKADMFCAAHINGVWERGQICSDITSSNIAEVIRCDHGNTEKVHISNLRPLPPALMGSLALECALTDIRPAGGRSTWTATASDLFTYYLTGASAVMTVKGLTDERPLPVVLFSSNKLGQLISIAEFLANEGLALKKRTPRDALVQKPKETDAQSSVSETQTHGSDGEKKSTTSPDLPAPSLIPLPSSLVPLPSSLVSTCIPPKPAPRSIMSAEKVKTQLYDPPELPCLGQIQTSVSAIGEDGLIYIRTQNAECQLEQLKERIQQSMKTLPRQKPYTWKSVQGCAVFGPDMSWCRGQLLEVLGGHVKVQYVDYGHVENIPVVHVYPVLLCEDVPQLCIPCLLHGVNPIGGKWQPYAVALLRELLLNRCVDMHVTELPSDPREPLTVEIFLDGLSLSRILCHHGHASMDGTVSAQTGPSVTSPAIFLDDWDLDTEGLKDPEEPMLGSFVNPNLPQKGERFQVRVKHLRTPNEVFLWSLEGTAEVEVDGEKLDEALTRINENVTSLKRLTNFPHGAPCLAEYSDGKFYRAKLMNFTTVEPLMIMIQHVDYGSEDTLPVSKLRQMPAELLKFPSKALKVKVAGFKAPSVNMEENVLPYSPNWSVKAALEMIDLLQNITASVVAYEPELTVLLYNKDGELVHLPLVSSGLAELE